MTENNSEIILYTVQETDTVDIQALSVYANMPNGLLTVSRLAAVLYGQQDQVRLLASALGNLLATEPSVADQPQLELETLAQIMDRAEAFVRSTGGTAILGFTYEAPEELKEALTNLQDISEIELPVE